MFLFQDTPDITRSTAYEVGYSIGYFVGENSTLILILAGFVLAFLLLFLLRKRRKRLAKNN